MGNNSPWIEGKGEIKKAAQHFAAKFWWTLDLFILSPTISENVLTWDRFALVVSFFVRYEINFAALIRLEIYGLDFDETTIESSATFYSKFTPF